MPKLPICGRCGEPADIAKEYILRFDEKARLIPAREAARKAKVVYHLRCRQAEVEAQDPAE